MKRAIAAAIVACVSLAPAMAPAAPPALGLNVHQSSTVGLDATRDAGLRWVRIDLNWVNVEQSQGNLDYAVIDAVVDGAKARGLEVLGVIGYGPTWASSGDGKGDGPNNDVPQPGLYAEFVKQTVARYEGRITHYELWNEPNLGDFFEGEPQDYIDRVLVPGADALHATCASCKVVAPGLATVGGEYDVWMDAVLGAAKDRIDIVSGHIYAGFPVDGKGPGKSSDSFYNKLEAHRVVEVGGVVAYEGPASFREVMMKHGVNKPFWLTETGETAKLGDAAEEERQAVYYRQVLEAMLSRPWWQATIFYEAFDEYATPQYTWGVVMHDDAAPGGYKPKKVMSLLKKVTSEAAYFGGDGAACSDGLDNDLDGAVDFGQDTDCKGPITPSEGVPSQGGAGGATGAGGEPGDGGAGGEPAAGGAPGGGAQAGKGGAAQTGGAPQGGKGGAKGGAGGAEQGGDPGQVTGKPGPDLVEGDLPPQPADSSGDEGGCGVPRGRAGAAGALLCASVAALSGVRRRARRQR